QTAKILENVVIPRRQPALAIFHISQCTETTNLISNTQSAPLNGFKRRESRIGRKTGSGENTGIGVYQTVSALICGAGLHQKMLYLRRSAKRRCGSEVRADLVVRNCACGNSRCKSVCLPVEHVLSCRCT